MNREKQLAINTIIIALGKICTQLVTFVLLPLYTSILSTEEYGIVDLLNTLVGLFIPILMLQIDQGVFRELIENRDKDENKKKIITSSIYMVIFQCIFYFLFFIIISSFVNNKYKYFLLLNVIAYSFPTLFLQIARGLGNNTIYSKGSFLIAFSTIIFNIIFILFFNMRAIGMLLGTLMGQIFGGVYLFLKLNLYKYLNKKFFSIKKLKTLINYSLPLIPNSISWWVFNASDRVIVSVFLGLAANGILSAANKFSALYISAYAIIYMSWTESISLNINDQDIDIYFNNTFNILLRLFISVAFGIISSMPFLYPMLLNIKFIDGYVLVPILMIAGIFNVIAGLLGSVYVAKKNTKSIANTSIYSAIINVFINILLIKFIGLYAAAISTLAAYLVMTFYRVYNINKEYFNIKFDRNLLAGSLLIGSIILICYYVNTLFVNIISIIISVIFAVIMNRNSLQTILNIIKKKAGVK